MKFFAIPLFLFLFFNSKAQEFELKNQKLIDYYQHINNAESNIVDGELDSARFFYHQAFSAYEMPHAKDIFNNMQVAIKLKDKILFNKQYNALKCLEFQFEDDFITANEALLDKKKVKCNIKLNAELRKKLDSLFVIDQKYRKLANGNYVNYKEEITESDSIASTSLLKLIEKYGFPSEYDLGLKSSDKRFFQHFYFIIWHQMAKNSISPQRINFSKILLNALNEGKISPENAGFLIDLNNGTRTYNTEAVALHGFLKGNVDLKDWDAIKKNMDCCYVDKYLLKENRTPQIDSNIEAKNRVRLKLGLTSLEDFVRKNMFRQDNKEFVFPDTNVILHNYTNESDLGQFKSKYVRLK